MPGGFVPDEDMSERHSCLSSLTEASRDWTVSVKELTRSAGDAPDMLGVTDAARGGGEAGAVGVGTVGLSGGVVADEDRLDRDTRLSRASRSDNWTAATKVVASITRIGGEVFPLGALLLKGGEIERGDRE